MTQTIEYSVENQIATIAFNRPQSMNAFDNVMADELVSVTETIRSDKNIRAVLLKGNGPLFMAGGDIRFFYENLPRMPEGVMKIVRTLNISIMNLMHMSKPVLASVHGSVAGVGMSFMMATDLVIAAESTKFTMAYSGLGISADGGASFNLPRIVGTKKAMEWLLLPDVFTAQEAKAAGLINWVAPDDQIMDATQKMLMRLANGPTVSYAKIKRLLNHTYQNSLESQLELEGQAFEFCSTTKDFKSGVTAFLEKKRPQFVGE